jgi:hypothetical protein
VEDVLSWEKRKACPWAMTFNPSLPPSSPFWGDGQQGPSLPGSLVSFINGGLLTPLGHAPC